MSVPPNSTAAVAFWDALFSQPAPAGDGGVDFPEPGDGVLDAARAHFGDLQGRIVVDLGCGRGGTSLYFASQGAQVIAVDTSGVAVANLREFCERRNITGVRPVQLSALDAHEWPSLPLGVDGAPLGRVDFVFGSMILHHIEPFDVFAQRLRDLMKPGGRGFFFENNARSPLLIWFRDHVVGRGWIPKFGDPDEFPLTPDEVDVLRKHFTVEVSYPFLKFFRLVSQYLLRGRAEQAFVRLDGWAYRRLPFLRKHSYVQFIKLS